MGFCPWKPRSSNLLLFFRTSETEMTIWPLPDPDCSVAIVEANKDGIAAVCLLTQWNKYAGRFVSGKYTRHIPMDTTSPLPETLDRRRRRGRRRHALHRSRTTIRVREVPESFE